MQNNLSKKIVYLTVILLIAGLFFISDISLLEAKSTVGDPYYFLKKQLVWVAISIVALIFFAKIRLDRLKNLSFLFYFGSIVLLILVLIPGIGTQIWGARRWINLNGFTIQPSEFAKISLLIYMAFLFTDEKKRDIKNFITITLPLFLLVVLEPDFGTAAIIIAIAFSIYFISGAPIKKLLPTSLATILIGILFIAIFPYRRKRVMALLDPFYDPLGDSYHVYQIVLTLASGGMLGRGIGESRQKYQYLPQVTTDSIMAVIGEELGFLGLLVFIGLLMLFVIITFKIAKEKTDPLAKLISAGMGAWIGAQGLLNLSSIAILLPLTGIPFPFISYGGSSLLALMIGIGLVINVNNNLK